MKFGAIIAALVLFFAAVSIPDYADAARMGGGKSFGSKPSMSTTARQPAGMQRQATPGAPAAGAAAAKPGLLGGMGGLFGGLLAGTLLGSLLSGNGFGGGGFLDIILFAILAFVAWKLFQRFRASRGQQPAPQPAAAGAPGGMFGQQPQYDAQAGQPMQRNDSAGGMWDRMRGMTQGAGASAFGATPQVGEGVDIPAGFDADEFLRGAKMAYTRMQQSWDRRDLTDIAQFATPSVMRELKAQADADPNPSHTEIMMVNAQLAGVEEEGENTRAQVYFDVMMREDPSQQSPINAREIWHFLRIGKDGNWRLDGIQQVE